MRELNAIFGRILMGALILGVALSQWLATANELAQEREQRQALEAQIAQLNAQLAEAQRINESLTAQLADAQRAEQERTQALTQTQNQLVEAERANAQLRGMLAQAMYANLQLQDRIERLAQPESPRSPNAETETPENLLPGALAGGGIGLTVLVLTLVGALRARRIRGPGAGGP